VGSIFFYQHSLHSSRASTFDTDLCFFAVEVLRYQFNQFCIGLAIHGQGFQLRQPAAVLHFGQCAGACVGFNFDLEGFQRSWFKVLALAAAASACASPAAEGCELPGLVKVRTHLKLTSVFYQIHLNFQLLEISIALPVHFLVVYCADPSDFL